MTKTIKILLFVMVLLVPSFSFASMSSTNYAVPKDVLNQVGGESVSSNFKIVHSLGESVAGHSASTNFQLDSGFLEPQIEFLSFSISPNTIDLGTMTQFAVSTGSITLTTSTSSLWGYAITAYDDTPVGIEYGMLDGVKKIADATTPNTFVAIPSAGTEHYGIITTGTHADAGYVAGTKINSLDNTARSNISSYSSFIENDSQTVQFRAGITPSTSAGTYHTTTTFICTGNF